MLPAQGGSLPEKSRYGEHWGYVQNVREERNLRVVEMVLVEKPPLSELPLNSLIFVPRLNKEFQERYEEQFGRSIPEQSFNGTRRYTSLDYFSGPRVSMEEYNQKERVYGEFVLRRLVEFHVDKYAQSSPELRPVYEVKEKMSNLRMELKRGYQVKLHYSFSGNYIDLSIENPLEIETKILFQMENKSVLPTSKSETTLSLGYPLSSSLRLASYYGFQKREFSMAGYKLLENNISTSLTGSTLVLEDSTQDNRIIVGLSWNH